MKLLGGWVIREGKAFPNTMPIPINHLYSSWIYTIVSAGTVNKKAPPLNAQSPYSGALAILVMNSISFRNKNEAPDFSQGGGAYARLSLQFDEYVHELR